MDKVYKLMSHCIYRLLSTRTTSAFPSALHSPFRCFCPKRVGTPSPLVNIWSKGRIKGKQQPLGAKWWQTATDIASLAASELTGFACSTTSLDKERFAGRKHFSPAPKHRGGWYQLPNHAGSPALRLAHNSSTTATKQRGSCSCLTFL